MVTRDFSGEDVAKVLANVGPFYVKNVTGSHIVLKCEPPDHHDTDPRTVSVPRHDPIRLGTLRSIADDAGAKDFDWFCEWIDRNC
jgi:predicted RNA binding protein YcfA (HicA-like mRNA interferase family)